MAEIQQNRTHKPVMVGPSADGWFVEFEGQIQECRVAVWVMCQFTEHTNGSSSTVSTKMHGYVVGPDGTLECAESYPAFVRYRR